MDKLIASSSREATEDNGIDNCPTLKSALVYKCTNESKPISMANEVNSAPSSLFDFTLVEAAPGLRLVLLANPPDFTVVAISRDLCRLLGADRENLSGMRFLDVCNKFGLPSNSREFDRLEASLMYVLSHKTQHRAPDIEFIFQLPDIPATKNKWTAIHTPVFDADNQIAFIINTVEEKDAEMESRLRQTFAIETVGVIYFNLEGFILDANSAFQKMSGYSRDDFMNGKVRWDELTPREFIPVTEKSRQEFINDGKNTPYEKQYIRPDGSRWWGLFAGKRLSENECVEFVLDITRVAARTRELECANQELMRSNNSLQEFAYAASHDLKEPIRKIQIFLDSLRHTLEGRLSENEMSFIERILNAAKRMNSLIEDLLVYSYLDNDANLERVDLNEVIDLVLIDLEVEIERKQAIIHVDKLFSIRGHPRKMQQVFHNLIGNSLKYSREGVPPEIHIKCQKLAGEDIKRFTVPLNTDYYLITISDNGIGFEQNYSDQIFNMFTRLHHTRHFSGTGIGLSIVRSDRKS